MRKKDMNYIVDDAFEIMGYIPAKTNDNMRVGFTYQETRALMNQVYKLTREAFQK